MQRLFGRKSEQSTDPDSPQLAMFNEAESLAEPATADATTTLQNADDFSAAIFASVDRLAQFPAMGREGRVQNTREWAVPNWSYLIPYRVRGDRLQIFGVFHTRQRPRTTW